MTNTRVRQCADRQEVSRAALEASLRSFLGSSRLEPPKAGQVEPSPTR